MGRLSSPEAATVLGVYVAWEKAKRDLATATVSKPVLDLEVCLPGAAFTMTPGILSVQLCQD